jgi:uncharacterized membrane protein YoaK (UPF0700 family)
MSKKDGLILLLTWTAGCLDALSFLGLEHVFVANMTGNTVLFGLAIAQGDWLGTLRSLIAMLGFSLGALGGTLLVERNYEQNDGRWSRQVLLALGIEAALLLAFALGWPLVNAKRTLHPVADALLALASLAIGEQSAVVLSLGVPGVSTTYITGTITTLMASLGRRLFVDIQKPPAVARRIDAQVERLKPLRMAAVWLTYIVAAICAGLSVLHLTWLAPYLPLLAILTVLIGALTSLQSKTKEGPEETTNDCIL